MFTSEPYPGLRSFKKDESDIFFGRDDHVDFMIDKLANSNFLCVTGPSGCGKSSLARTGLLNSLEAGFLPGKGSDWIICDFRPGSQPLNNLFVSLTEAVANYGQHSNNIKNKDSDNYEQEIYQLFMDHQKRRLGDLGETLEQITASKNKPILILVDQFEELFRISQSDPNSAVTFVDILLQSAKTCKNIYVVITIRTDELEKCSRYSGLTKAINESQFLTPVPDRYQIQEAIEGPIALFGGSIDPNFSLWLLNSLDEELDKLPLMQHALKLIYSQKRDKEKREDVILDISDFASTFDLDQAENLSRSESRYALRSSLSNQLDRIYAELPHVLKPAASKVFCVLTSTESQGRDIRNPTSLKVISQTIGETTENTRNIIQHFTNGHESYLYIPDTDQPDDDVVVDITHECVLRLWDTLQKDWLTKERQSSEHIIHLGKSANKYFKNMKNRNLFLKFFDPGTLPIYELKNHEKWVSDNKPNKVWASRYLDKIHWSEQANDANGKSLDSNQIYDKIENFADASRTQRQTKFAFVGLMICTILVAIGYFNYQYKQSNLKDRNTKQLQTFVELSNNILGTNDTTKIVSTLSSSLQKAIELDDDLVGLKEKTGQSLFKSLDLSHELYRYRYRQEKSEDQQVRAADISPDGKLVFSLNSGGIIRIWHTSSPNEAAKELNLKPDETTIKHEGRSIKISPKGELAVAGFRNGSIFIIDIEKETWQQLMIDGKNPHFQSVLDIQFTSDGSKLITSSYDGKIIVWKHLSDNSENIITNSLFDWHPTFEFNWHKFYEKSEKYQQIDEVDGDFTRAGELWSVDISKEKNLITFGLGNGRVCIIEQNSQAVPYCSKAGHLSNKRVKSIKFQPKKPYLVSAGDDDTGTVWKIHSKSSLPTKIEPLNSTIAHEESIWDVTFNKEGNLLATASDDKTVKIYESNTWQPLAKIEGHSASIRTVRFDPSSKKQIKLLTGSIDQTVRIWTPFLTATDDKDLSIQFLRKNTSNRFKEIQSIALSPFADSVAFTDKNYVRVKERHNKLIQLPHSTKLSSSHLNNLTLSQLIYHPTEPKLFASALQSKLFQWEQLPESKWKSDFIELDSMEFKNARAFSISPEKSMLAVAVKSSMSSSILLCKIDTNNFSKTCSKEAGNFIRNILFTPLSEGNNCSRKKDILPLSLSFSKDGSMLAVGGSNCVVRIYNTKTGDEIGKPFLGHIGEISSVNFSPDGKYIVSGSLDWITRVWSIETGKNKKLEKHGSKITDAAFSPSGKSIVTVSGDGSSILWNFNDFTEITMNTQSYHKAGDVLDVHLIEGKNGPVMGIGTSKGIVKVSSFFEDSVSIQKYAKSYLKNILGN